MTSKEPTAEIRLTRDQLRIVQTALQDFKYTVDHLPEIIRLCPPGDVETILLIVRQSRADLSEVVPIGVRKVLE